MSQTSAIDHAQAEQQWQHLCSALKQCGCEVEIIEPVQGLEDMVFAANQVFVGSHPRLGNSIVPSRMVHASRQREVPFYVDWFRQRGFEIIDLQLSEDEYLEGHGDLLWHPDGSRIYAGYGFRSTESGIAKFCNAISKRDVPVVQLRLIDRFCYHLDTCLCPLNNEAVLVYPGAFAPDSLAKLRTFWKRVHELTAEEAHKFMGNGIAVNGRYLTPYLTPHLGEILKQESLTPVILNTSEFEKSGGSLFCMKAFLP